MTAGLVVGNWKMHGGSITGPELATQIVQGLRESPGSVEVVLAPPFTALTRVGETIGDSAIKLAAQNSHWDESGAFTGEISPPMLAEVGCEFVIVGHSERRHIFSESDDMIARKVAAVIKHGMRPILCIGETSDERRAGQTATVIARQLIAALKGVTEDAIQQLDVAYEPVWAIGTGQNATSEQICEAHTQIRKLLQDRFGRIDPQQTRILYGGSVKPENAAMLAAITEVNGVLVGGASLIAESFLAIVRAFSSR